MIRVVVGQEVVYRTIVWNSSTSDVNIGLLAPVTEEVEDIDLNIWEPGGVWAPENWKEITHLKIDGELSTAVGNSGRRHDKPWNAPADGVGYSTNGYTTGSYYRYYYFPVGTTGFTVKDNTFIGVRSEVIGSRVGYRFVRFNVASHRRAGQTFWYVSGGSGSPGTTFPPGSEDFPSRSAALAFCFVYANASLSGEWSLTGYPSSRYKPGSKDSFPSIASVKEYLTRERNMFRSLAERSVAEITPELHASSFDGIQKFDGNLLAFISELPSFGTTGVGSLIELLRSSPSKASIASFWLSNRYGDRLSFRDAKDLFQSFDRELFKARTTRYVIGKGRLSELVSDGYFTDVNVFHACQLAVSPRDSNALMRAIRHAYEWDYYPSLGNVWDMIPLSFVVDWFVNVGDIYESVDRLVQARYYDVQRILQSVKAEATSPLFPAVRLSYYRRWLSSNLQLGVSSVELGLPSVLNVVDGLALLAM